VRSAARLGLPTLSSFFVPVEEIVRRRQLYREEALARGHSGEEIAELDRQSWGMQVVHMAPTHEEAVRVVEPPFMGYQRRMAVLRSESTGGSLPDSFDRSLVRLRPFREYLENGMALVGAPSEVRKGLQEYIDATGFRRVMLLMAIPGLDTDLALRSMRLFAEESW
jgi:alkanesulfonate monooxygenase SsuD/methylene tetrahydromethanopterin reductase-like flavin-dependent oxidoreductase (luciferase family)